MENNLPKGWTTVSPLELSEKIRGVSYGKEDVFNEHKDDTIPVLRANAIEDDKIVYDDLVFVKAARVSKNQLLQSGDVLIAMSSGSKNLVGKTAQYFDNKVATFGAFCGVLRPNVEVNSKYFGYFFKSRDYRNTISDLAAGTNINNLKNEHFESLRIPVAPLAEQQRIVAKLDELMEKIDRSRARMERIPNILERFRQSILAAAVSGKLTEEWRRNDEYNEQTNLPLSWKLVLIDQLVKSTKIDIRTGPFGTSLKKNEHQDKGIPVWGIETIGENGVFTGHNKIFVTSEKAKELRSFEVRGGDIIISRSGTVGEICILPEDVQFGLISTNLMKIVLDKTVILSKYFCWLFNGSFIVMEKLNDLCKGSTRIFLTQSILKQIYYPLPPLEEQEEIVRRVEQLFLFVEKIEARYNKAKENLDRLPQSLLAKAFRGDLVPQDENDEPAIELLNKIRQQKAAKLKSKENGLGRRTEPELAMAAEPVVQFKRKKR